MEAPTTDTTPVTTTETSPAAPAISAPSPTVTTSERPQSFEDAFEQVAAQQEKAASAPPDPAAIAQADTTNPESAPNPSTDKKGPVPFEVHSKALDNARIKEREAVAKEWAPYAWAKDVPRETVAEFSRIANRMSSDPIGFLSDFVKELEAHPTHAAQLRSHAGRILSGGRTTAPPDLSPDVEVRDENNQVVSRTFSADRVQALITKAVQDAIGKEVAPLKTDHQNRVNAERAAATERQLSDKADGVMAELHDILEITDAKAEGSVALFAAVNDVMTKNPTWSAEKAARQVWRTHVRAGLERKAEQTVLDNHKKKAAGNTAGSGSASATPARPRNPKELASWLEANARR